jgi:thymidylate synthase
MIIQPGDLAYTGDLAWRDALRTVIAEGQHVSPRGKGTTELLVNSVTVDLARSVVTTPARKLNYRFMCAEALWILDGGNELAPLTRFVKRMADFSDDGVTLAGAYGPRLVPQLSYVVQALVSDRSTRQAVASIWTPNPAPSKDIPCSLVAVFSIRQNRLYQHVMMRSSDLWLGLPYDLFSFSCWGIYVACKVNMSLKVLGQPFTPVGLGHLTVTATSSHLYDDNLEAAQMSLAGVPGRAQESCPLSLVIAGDWDRLRDDLEAQREGGTGTHWRFVP